jgi:hypothetical protein
MQSHDVNDHYRITLSEMSRRSQVEISTWFNGWLAGSGDMLDKLKVVSAISTQVILYSRLALYRDGEKLPEGTYELEDGVTITLPLTEVCLNELPASLVAWLIDAAGRENAFVLESFLAGARAIQKNMTNRLARRSASGPSNEPPAH